MKKLLFILLLGLVLVGCNVDNTEETFLVFNDQVLLNENEGIYIPINYTGINEDRINVTFSNKDILEFDNEKMYIKAKKIGYTNMFIEVQDSDYTATIDVFIEAAVKDRVAPIMQTSNRDIKVGNPFTFYITNLDKLGSPLERYNFTLSDETLADIDEFFIIHPKKPGILKITATHEISPLLTSSFEVNILENDNSEKLIITTNESLFVVKPGEYLDLYVDGQRANENDYYFSSYNTDYASITADGKVVGIKNGLAYIGVTSKSTNKNGVIYLNVQGQTNQVDYIERVIEKALAQKGYKEGRNGWTKFGEWYEKNYALLDWCAMFVAWSANEAGIPTTVIPRLAKVEFMKNFYERKGTFEYTGDYIPKRGDIIIFENTSHVGIVLYSKDGRVYTIEGNTSNTVAERNYSLTDTYVLGYGIPDYKRLNY